MFAERWTPRRILEKITKGKTYSPARTKQDHKQKKEAKHRSKQFDRALKADWRNETSRIKLLLLGPGEAGKSTLIKQMQLIHGDDMEHVERIKKIPFIRQNIFDSMVAILVAMRSMGIGLADSSLDSRAQRILRHSQVYNPRLTPKDILESSYLASEEMISDVRQLWNDNGIHKAYSRSNEYQLLDCAAYFFDRLDDIRSHNYIPTEQDVLRCRVMTTSITETRFSAPYSGQKVNFKVLDVGGQQGERRKWITLFDGVTAVLYMMDASSFDQTLREDSKTSRLLESLKVFYQTVTTRYLRSVSILTFMNKIDLLKEKIESGGDFLLSMNRMRDQAKALSQDSTVSNDFERRIYQQIHFILTSHPYSTYVPTESQRKHIVDSFSTFAKQERRPSPDFNQNVGIYNSSPSFAKRFTTRKSKKSLDSVPDLDERVIKAGSYLKFVLVKIVECVKLCSQYKFQSTSDMSMDIGNRSYEYNYSCAVDKSNIERVIDGCKNIIIQEYFGKYGI